jgi:hypothetical protein
MDDVFVKDRLPDRPAARGEIEPGLACPAMADPKTIEDSGIRRRFISIVIIEDIERVEVLESLLC